VVGELQGISATPKACELQSRGPYRETSPSWANSRVRFASFLQRERRESSHRLRTRLWAEVCASARSRGWCSANSDIARGSIRAAPQRNAIALAEVARPGATL